MSSTITMKQKKVTKHTVVYECDTEGAIVRSVYVDKGPLGALTPGTPGYPQEIILTISPALPDLS